MTLQKCFFLAQNCQPKVYRHDKETLKLWTKESLVSDMRKDATLRTKIADILIKILKYKDVTFKYAFYSKH